MKRRKKNQYILILVVLLVSIGIGYAFLSQDLTINGTGKVAANNWSIYFDNLVLNQNNVALSTGDSAATINPTTLTDVTYTITLQKPGDFYEFTVDVVNDGSIDAMIGSVSNKLGGVEIDATHPLPSYLNYTVTYSDGGPIQVNQLLEQNTSETYKVRLEYRTDITANDLPSTSQTLTLNFSVEYVQADENAIIVAHPVSFSTDSWDTIIAAVRSGNTSAYHVGDTKSVELGNNIGTYTLRIANMSTPAECSTTGFSQSACGFVLEFADIITTHVMNPAGEYKGVQYEFGWNIDGWPASELRTYLNDKNNSISIINSLPEVLRNAIIDTTVVSGHGPTEGETNFISDDKLYLLTIVEIFGSEDEYDTVTLNETRQLDYYANLNVSFSNYSDVVKQYNNKTPHWWLRSARSTGKTFFCAVYKTGGLYSSNAYSPHGVSPAFRLG